jgi:hypothetical protein
MTDRQEKETNIKQVLQEKGILEQPVKPRRRRGIKMCDPYNSFEKGVRSETE